MMNTAIQQNLASDYALHLPFCEVWKREEDRFIFSVALKSEIEDAQGDIISARDVELAAWSFAEQGFVAGLMHKEALRPSEAIVVESFVFRPHDMGGAITIVGKTFETLTWFLGWKLGEETWKLVKARKIRGLSIGGRGNRTAIKRSSDEGGPSGVLDIISDGESPFSIGRADGELLFLVLKEKPLFGVCWKDPYSMEGSLAQWSRVAKLYREAVVRGN